jgi:hypothetical protein
MAQPARNDFCLDRMVQAVERVRQLLVRSTAALEAARVPYAVIGGNAVAVWVARVDEAAVRNTRDVDILLHVCDVPRAKAALASAGIDLCLEAPGLKDRGSVHMLYANEKARADYLLPTPDVADSEPGPAYRILKLEALVRMKLNSFRIIDRVHLRDMLEVGLIDASWLARLPPPLASRLQELIDTPEG